MIYVPFLKLKNNEVSALVDLEANLLTKVTPIFDIPRIKDMNEAEFINRIRIALKSLNSHWNKDKWFYIDVFDIPPSLKPEGRDIYGYTLDVFSEFNIIPVVGLDRDQEHLDSVVALLKKKPNKIKVAIRLLPSDFISFDAVEFEIDDLLGEIIDISKSVDLLLDARSLVGSSVKKVASDAAAFANKFASKYVCRRIVIAGSSIPSSISEVVGTNEEALFDRLEKQLWSTFNSMCTVSNSFKSYGDYCVVSPEYSDIDLSPEMLPNIATPKIIYTCDNKYYAVRGAAFKTHPLKFKQYFNLAKIVAAKSFYRGSTFSAGDEYIYQRSSGKGTSGSPGSWIKVAVNAHISFVGHEFSLTL
jgi:hypothetical protein